VRGGTCFCMEVVFSPRCRERSRESRQLHCERRSGSYSLRRHAHRQSGIAGGHARNGPTTAGTSHHPISTRRQLPYNLSIGRTPADRADSQVLAFGAAATADRVIRSVTSEVSSIRSTGVTKRQSPTSYSQDLRPNPTAREMPPPRKLPIRNSSGSRKMPILTIPALEQAKAEYASCSEFLAVSLRV
jgi:hypothetical protein